MSGVSPTGPRSEAELSASIERLRTQITDLQGWVVLLAGIDAVVLVIVFILPVR